MYSLDFTSISMENLNFIFIIQHKHVLYNLEKITDLIYCQQGPEVNFITIFNFC